jgi:hypothetical protein
MSRIDYSKWDKLDEYDDLSDDDNNDSVRPVGQGARVTRLDQPSTVTRTETGEIIIQDATVVAEDDESDIVKRSSGSNGRNRDPESQSLPNDGESDPEFASLRRSTPVVPDPWTDKGGSCEYHGTSVHWSQDRLTVTIRVRLPSSRDEDLDMLSKSKLAVTTTSKQQQQGGRYLCTVSHMLPYGRRDSAVSQERCRLRIVDRWWGGSDGGVVVDGELPHPVHANQDDNDDDKEVKAGDDMAQIDDWVIQRIHDDAAGTDVKWIEVSLNKASPMSGLTLWWKQPFVDAPEIPAERLPTSSSASSQAFASAWKEAHEQFQEKIKRQKAGAQLEEGSGASSPTAASPGTAEE